MRYCEICRASFQDRRTCPRDGLPTRDDISDPLVGAVLGERYRVLDRVASGGMGHVYRAAHARMACLFAVKVLYGDLAYDATMRARFEREAEVASLLQSRYIVRVVDFSQSDSGLLYLAMEYLDGETIADRVDRGGALDPVSSLSLIVQIARGLSHAHERGVIHRDLKGENVIVVQEDDTEVPKILDFGVARLRSAQEAGGRVLTGARTVVGTPAYMAPEQFAGGEVDGRTDLYALGILLHTMITGALPFESTSSIDLMRKHLTEPPPALASRVRFSTTRAPFVAALEPMVRRLLAKRREDRHASARDFVAEARRLLDWGTGSSDLGPASDRPRPTPGTDTHAPREAPDLSGSSSKVPTVDPALIEAIQGAIVLGAPTYNSGDHSGCYETYRRVAIAELSRKGPTLGMAERARLEVALEEASRAAFPTLAAWTMRHAFDDLTSATPASVGSSGAPRDDVDTAIDVFHAVSARVYCLGHTSSALGFHMSFASLLADELPKLPGRTEDMRLLDRCLDELRLASRADAASSALSEVFEKIRGERTRTRRLETSPTVVGAPNVVVPDLVRDAILRAIRVGVPAYNAGDQQGCAREYQRTADAIVGETLRLPETRMLAAWLGPITERARVASAHDAAWMLRHAFDAMLAL